MDTLNFRPLEETDYLELNRLNKQQDFDLDNIDNPIIDGFITSNENIVAYGIVKHFAEAVILLDLNTSKRTRIGALRELMKVAIFGTERAGLKQLHVFTKNKQVARLLMKHFNFKLEESISLVRNL